MGGSHRGVDVGDQRVRNRAVGAQHHVAGRTLQKGLTGHFRRLGGCNLVDVSLPVETAQDGTAEERIGILGRERLPFHLTRGIVRYLESAIDGRNHIDVGTGDLLQPRDDFQRGTVEILRNPVFPDGQFRDAGHGLLELDLQHVLSGLQEIIQVCLDGGLAFLAVGKKPAGA